MPQPTHGIKVHINFHGEAYPKKLTTICNNGKQNQTKKTLSHLPERAMRRSLWDVEQWCSPSFAAAPAPSLLLNFNFNLKVLALWRFGAKNESPNLTQILPYPKPYNVQNLKRMYSSATSTTPMHMEATTQLIKIEFLLRWFSSMHICSCVLSLRLCCLPMSVTTSPLDCLPLQIFPRFHWIKWSYVHIITAFNVSQFHNIATFEDPCVWRSTKKPIADQLHKGDGWNYLIHPT